MRVITWNMQGANHNTENKWNIWVLPLLRESAGGRCATGIGATLESGIQRAGGRLHGHLGRHRAQS